MSQTVQSNFRFMHIRNLAALANIDDIIDQEEYNFLCDLALKYEMETTVVDEIIANLGDTKPEIPENLDQRIGQLLDLVRMMMADHKIDKREMYFCENVATGYGFDRKIIDFMVDKYEQDKASFKKWQELILQAHKFYLEN